MHATQRRYLRAKARVETLRAVVELESVSIPELTDENDAAQIDAYCEALAAIERQTGFSIAWRELHEAEQALLDWGHSIVKAMPGYTPECDVAFNAPLLSIRNQAVALTLRLSA
jgi:hypothetical protein